jgi:hypothetical protein
VGRARFGRYDDRPWRWPKYIKSPNRRPCIGARPCARATTRRTDQGHDIGFWSLVLNTLLQRSLVVVLYLFIVVSSVVFSSQSPWTVFPPKTTRTYLVAMIVSCSAPTPEQNGRFPFFYHFRFRSSSGPPRGIHVCVRVFSCNTTRPIMCVIFLRPPSAVCVGLC